MSECIGEMQCVASSLLIVVCCLLCVILGQVSSPNASVQTPKIYSFRMPILPNIEPKLDPILGQVGPKRRRGAHDGSQMPQEFDLEQISVPLWGPRWGYVGAISGSYVIEQASLRHRRAI